jgi:uncharacterized protein (TIGR03437 family)
MKGFCLACFLILAAGSALAQPTVTGVVNAASNTLPGIPAAPLAQGSLAVAYGRNLGPANLVLASTLPWPATLAGTSAQIVAAGQTIPLLIYYTSANQIAFLVPSNTPAGGGTIQVTYNGQTGPTFNIGTTVSNLGIFTRNSQGFGPAIVTYPDYSLVSNRKDANCGGPNTNCGAANPGQTLILWATGLGPVSGNETTTPQPGDMTNLAFRLWIGGVSANVVYRGRSGCCVAEDQIVFVVPDNVSGCAVPIAAQVNNLVSNYGTIAIAPTGSTCTPYTSDVPPDFITQLPGKASPTIGVVSLSRNVQDKSDRGEVDFLKLNAPGQVLADAINSPPLGACTVVTYFNSNGPPNRDPTDDLPFSTLDGGASISVNGSGRTRTLPKAPDGTYPANLGDGTAGNYLDPGVYTVTGTGGANVGSFTTSVTVPQPLVWTNPPANNTPVPRANGMTINWTGGDPNGFVFIEGQGGTATAPNSNTALGAAAFQCEARASAGTFFIPPSVLLTLPPFNANPGARPTFGFVQIRGRASPSTFTASGLDFGFTMVGYEPAVVGVGFQ